LEPEAPDSEGRGEKPLQTDKVVRLIPRDWLGPIDELVPLGPPADRSSAPPDDPDGAAATGDAGVWGEDDGFAAQSFWTADSASLQAPLVAGLGGRLGALRDLGRRRLVPIAAAALAAVVLVTLAIVGSAGSAGSGRPPRTAGAELAASGKRSDRDAPAAAPSSHSQPRKQTQARAPGRRSHRHRVAVRPNRRPARQTGRSSPARSGRPVASGSGGQTASASTPQAPADTPPASSSTYTPPVSSGSSASGSGSSNGGSGTGGGGCFPGDVGC
jgi:hypothetical protein